MNDKNLTQDKSSQLESTQKHKLRLGTYVKFPSVRRAKHMQYLLVGVSSALFPCLRIQIGEKCWCENKLKNITGKNFWGKMRTEIKILVNNTL